MVNQQTVQHIVYFVIFYDMTNKIEGYNDPYNIAEDVLVKTNIQMINLKIIKWFNVYYNAR